MIDIKFNDNIKHNYSSFKEILKLDNYDDIIYINCYNSLYNLPSLPNSLQILYCAYNNLSNLPKLPNSLIHLNCSANNLSSLPELPNSLMDLWCHHNNLSNLPDLPNSLKSLYYNNNPIYIHIQKYFDGNTNIYNEYQTIITYKFRDCSYIHSFRIRSSNFIRKSV